MTDIIKALEATRQHELKTDPEVFDAVRAGLKTHEIRRNDRDFRVGDTLLLRKTRYTGQQMHMRDLPLEYTGDECTRVVSHVLDGYGLQDGWVILSFADHRAALGAVQAEPKEYSECSGDPASCPENEGYGCCKANPTIQRTAPPEESPEDLRAAYALLFAENARLRALIDVQSSVAAELLAALKALCSHNNRDHAAIARDWDNARKAIVRAESSKPTDPLQELADESQRLGLYGGTADSAVSEKTCADCDGYGGLFQPGGGLCKTCRGNGKITDKASKL